MVGYYFFACYRVIRWQKKYLFSLSQLREMLGKVVQENCVQEGKNNKAHQKSAELTN